jgi:hypothetical protein
VDGWIGAVPVPSWASRAALSPDSCVAFSLGLNVPGAPPKGRTPKFSCDSRVAFSPDSWVAFSLDLKVPAPALGAALAAATAALLLGFDALAASGPARVAPITPEGRQKSVQFGPRAAPDGQLLA